MAQNNGPARQLLDSRYPNQTRIEAVVDSGDEYEDIEGSFANITNFPIWMNPDFYDLLRDDLVTATSEASEGVTSDCLPRLLGEETEGLPLNSHGIPHLRREKHAAFLRTQLAGFPAAYTQADASRPWFFYWAIAGLCSLGEDVSEYKDRLLQTLRPLQNASGGFGGGHGQLSHLAGTYACLLALACVDGLEIVDRRALWHFLGSVKSSNGGFHMAVAGEQDVRGAYCAMTAISLLNLPLELPSQAPARQSGLQTFTDGLGEWIGRCQTYEGGIAGAPSNEAHGAYAFCALACLSIMDAPQVSIPKYLHVEPLMAWLAASQTVPEGGFQGRTNKLVDACYSHWSGGCWSMLQAAIGGGTVLGLWNREALIRYLLCCCQQASKRGGMRDKPSAQSDAYHTCYSLSGLSAAQNHYVYGADSIADGSPGALPAAFKWYAQRATAEEQAAWAYDEQDRVEFVHPVFVIPMNAVERARAQFELVGI